MYLPTANRVVALNPETGKEVWTYTMTGGAPSRRGVTYWPGDGTLQPRIFVTSGRRLIALGAATGVADTRFGTNGEIDLVVPYNSVPLAFKNILIVGANTVPGPVGAPGNPPFDARTGINSGSSARSRSRARRP
jgi:quinoprotein glucose dehydrogenase